MTRAGSSGEAQKASRGNPLRSSRRFRGSLIEPTTIRAQNEMRQQLGVALRAANRTADQLQDVETRIAHIGFDRLHDALDLLIRQDAATKQIRRRLVMRLEERH